MNRQMREALEDCVAFITGQVSGSAQRDGIIKEAIAALRSSADSEPVAYRVKDFADGWILCHTREVAEHEADGQCLIQALGVLDEVNQSETTKAGVIDWRMEAERANRLLAEAERRTLNEPQTPVMRAAERAAKTVAGWSDAKREYADRVTRTEPQAAAQRTED